MLFTTIEKFLIENSSLKAPYLLALSGGPDSLCLFYLLLSFREKHAIPFHAAHVDHAWREESKDEAIALEKLADRHAVPFHLKRLDPAKLKGNLEAACREERYLFFSELFKNFPFEAVLTGHHSDDQAETIFKRLLEGSHWSNWKGLNNICKMHNINVFRPLLKVTKKEILHQLEKDNIKAFEDPANTQDQFLRSRQRTTIFPWLNKEFGKNVQSSILLIGKEAEEISAYFEQKCACFLENIKEGPFGLFLDLQKKIPSNILEIKYLLRLLCKFKGLFLSREIVEEAAHSLQSGKADSHFLMGNCHLIIDRRCVFILDRNNKERLDFSIKINKPVSLESISVSETIFDPLDRPSDWKKGWEGQLECCLPPAEYELCFNSKTSLEALVLAQLRKNRSQAKAPSFIAQFFPLLCKEGKVIHDFVLGKQVEGLKAGDLCWKVKITRAKG